MGPGAACQGRLVSRSSGPAQRVELGDARTAVSPGRLWGPPARLRVLVPQAVAWNSCGCWREAAVLGSCVRACVCQSPRRRSAPLSNAFDFFPRSLAIKEFFSKPKYNHILKPEDCLSEPCTILQLDMRTVQIADLEVRPDALPSRVVSGARAPRLLCGCHEPCFDFPRVFASLYLILYFIFLSYFLYRWPLQHHPFFSDLCLIFSASLDSNTSYPVSSRTELKLFSLRLRTEVLILTCTSPCCHEVARVAAGPHWRGCGEVQEQRASVGVPGSPAGFRRAEQRGD